MARRINTRFVTVLLMILVGAGVALLLAQKLLIREHPERFIAAGQQAVKEDRWADATDAFAKASSLRPRDTDLLMQVGAAAHNAAKMEPDRAWQEEKAYEQALEVDPNYLPAVRALVTWYELAVAGNPNANFYSALIRYAHRAHELKPTDADLEPLADEFLVQEYIAGLANDDQELSDALDDLNKLMAKHPADSRIPFTIAEAKLQKGQEIARQSAAAEQPAEATALYQDAQKSFKDVLDGPKGGPQDANADMHYRYAQVLEFLSGIDQSTADMHNKDLDASWSQIQRARALSKEKDADYLQINQYAAELAQRRGDHDTAVKIYRSLPDRLEVRLALAELLGRSPETRAEGEQLMESGLSGIGGDPNRIVGARYSMTGLLTDLRISDYADSKDPAQKKILADQIQSSMDKLTTAVGSRTPLDLKRRQARFALLQGHAIDVIQDLNRQKADDPAVAKDYVCMTLLAEAYRQTAQAAEAIKILEDIVERYPRETLARKDLTKLLILESPDKAAVQLAELDRQDVGDPELVLMHLQMLSAPDQRDRNKEHIKQYFDQLTERTDQEVALKIRIAIQLQDWDSATRLLDQRLQTSKAPDDFVNLARVQMFLGHKDQALATASHGLELNPNSQVLKVMIPAIKGEDPKLVESLEEDLARQSPDKVQGELTLATLARQKGDLEGQESHLKAAEKLSPQSPRILRELFAFYLDSRTPNKAAQYLDRLAAMNDDGANGDLDRFRLAQAKGDIQGSLILAQKLTQQSPEFAATWVALGQALQAAGQYQQAVAQYVIALEKQSGNIDAYTGLIRCEYQLDRPDDALQYINTALAKFPNNSELRELLVTHQINYGNPIDAVQVIQNEIRRQPNSPDLYAALGMTCVRAAKTLEANHNHDMAVRALKSAIDGLTKTVARWPDHPGMYEALADAQMSAGLPQDAYKTLLAWSQRPAWHLRPQPHIRLAQFFEDCNQPDQAESELRTALARSNYRVDLQVAMANMLANHRKFDDALGLLKGVNSDKPAVRQGIVQILLRQGKYDDADATIKGYLAQNPPDSSRLLTIWAASLMERHDYNAAAQRATEALAIDPTNVDALYCRGRARLHKAPPDSDGALADLTAVRESAPANPQVRLDLAGAYLELGRLDDAAAELKAGLRANPYNKSVRMMLVSIYTTGPRPYLADALRLLKEVETIPPFDKDPAIFEREAEVYTQMKDLSSAVDAGQKAVALNPGNGTSQATYLAILLKLQRWQDVLDHIASLPPGMQATPWALMNRGIAERQRDPSPAGAAAATADFQNALALAEKYNDPDLFQKIILVMSEHVGYDATIAAVKPYVKDRLEAKLAMSELLHFKGEDSDAISQIDAVSADIDKLNHIQQVAVVSTAARIYQSAHPKPPVDKCYNALQLWLKLEPNNINALNNLACLLADNYSPPRATEGLVYAQKAVDEMTAMGQDNPDLLDTQGWLLILSGSPEQGVSILNKVVDSKPFPEACLHLGEGYLKLQYAQEAQRTAKQGLDLLAQQPKEAQDSGIRAKLQDLVARSEVMLKSKQQAQVP